MDIRRDRAGIAFLCSVTLITIMSVTFLMAKILPASICLLTGAGAVAGVLLLHSGIWQPQEILCLLMALLIPTSFQSFTGGSYGQLPLSWYNIIFLLLAFSALIHGLKKSYILWILTFAVLAVFCFLSREYLIDGLKQLINVLAFMAAVPLGEYVRRTQTDGFRQYLKYAYVAGTLVFAFLILLQYVLVHHVGLDVGVYTHFGGNRLAHAATFSDYSFATLYLVSGIAVLLYDIVYFKKYLIGDIFCCLFLFFASVIVSARTGLVALVAAFALWLVIKLFQNKGRFAAFLALGCMLAPLALYTMMLSRPEETLFSSSGRGLTYFAGLQCLIDNPLTGIGLGLTNYSNTANQTIPHNIIIQYLGQTGLLGSSILFLYILLWWKSYVSTNNPLFPVLLTVLIGAMAIPDIFNSRFIIVIFFLIMLYADAERQTQMPQRNTV